MNLKKNHINKTLRLPVLCENIDQRNFYFLTIIGKLLLFLLGWKFKGEFPDKNKKFLIIVAPHTSNWDFVMGILAVFALRLKVSFLGKDTLFRWPFRILFTWLGGIPIDRSSKNDIVARLTEKISRKEKVVLAIAPEGTRGKAERWKTGFFYIAKDADIPILPCYIFHDRKEIGLGRLIHASADLQDAFQEIQDFYTDNNIDVKIS